MASDIKGFSSTLLLVMTIAGVFVSSYFLLKSAPHLYHILGKTGINLITRLMGIILTAIAIQFIIDGTSTVLKELKKAESIELNRAPESR